ncbi:MAG: acylphosphatase [Phycisphaerae bacterium]|nr:acylphosphatase [Phycisphaerae bacterium]
MTARLVHFEGDVQGVGFRYTARSVARRYDVTGYVANLPDGRVEIHVEGPPNEIDRFVDEIRQEMGPYVENVQTQDVEPTGRYKQFTVRYF